MPVVGGTTYKKPDEPDFDLDFLTTLGRGGDVPLFVPALNLSLQALKCMEFCLDDPMKATLLYRNGPLVVNIPRPERYVWHTRIVYGERSPEQRAKANKDLVQVACVRDYVLENDADVVKATWQDVTSRGPDWLSRLRQGCVGLDARFPQQQFAQRMARLFL